MFAGWLAKEFAALTGHRFVPATMLAAVLAIATILLARLETDFLASSRPDPALSSPASVRPAITVGLFVGHHHSPEKPGMGRAQKA
jgi:hypothetical protein